MKDFLRVLSLLTVLPVRPGWEDCPEPGRVMGGYPLAGAVIGVVVACLAFVLDRIGLAGRAALLPAALVLAAWVGLTGALHLDGWADCCDALFVPASREKRLEIMKDPRLGSFGGVGLVVLLVVKLAAVQGVLATAGTVRTVWWSASPLAGPAAVAAGLLPLVLAPVLARWAVVIVARAYPSARREGMAVFFRRGLGARQLLLATATAAVAVAVVGPAGLVTWIVAAAALLLLAGAANARLGGVTGDVYGATIEFVEVTALVVTCLWRG